MCPLTAGGVSGGSSRQVVTMMVDPSLIGGTDGHSINTSSTNKSGGPSGRRGTVSGRTGRLYGSQENPGPTTAATQAVFVAAARPLFAEHGYATISTDQIARAAGVTRGALYHQFSGKEALFAAVVEQIEEEIAARIGADIAAATQQTQKR